MILGMMILSTLGWQDYELLDSGDGQRLERFGQYILVRPDPQVLWKPQLSQEFWGEVDAVFEKTEEERGKWHIKRKIPEKWVVKYEDLSFYCKLTPFKHTGVFPEQSLQWKWVEEKIKKSGREVNILNLFGYTGIASLICAKVGAKVTHVDASYPTIGWARENQKASGLMDKSIRWILDDAVKFCQREVKRGVKYDGILMDPPIYGHGPKGEKWDFNRSFPELVEVCSKLLSEKPLFVLANAYAISASALMLSNVLKDYLKEIGGVFEEGELVLEEKSGSPRPKTDRFLSTGIFARWSKV